MDNDWKSVDVAPPKFGDVRFGGTRVEPSRH
jgi:hypothetical protein